MSYKKRARSGWCGGKGYKKDSNRTERTYEKQEIRAELKEFEGGEDFRYKHHAKKKLTPEQKLQKQVGWYERVIGYWTRPNIKNSSWFDGWMEGNVSSYKHKLKKLKELLGQKSED